MSNGRPMIVIQGNCEDWPGGRRTLTPLQAEPRERPFRHAFWFSGQLDPGGNHVRFRTTREAIERMPANTVEERSAILVDCLNAWSRDHQDHEWTAVNDFEVYVDEGTGETRIEPHDE